MVSVWSATELVMRPSPAILYLLAVVATVMVGAAPPLSPMYAAICTQMSPCDVNSGPVCAIDAAGMPRTFGNACSVTLDNCLRNTNFAVVRKGEC